MLINLFSGMKLRYFVIILFAFLTSFMPTLQAQPISVSYINLDSITQILKSQFPEDCFEILNVTYTGDSLSIGLFTTPENSGFPIEKGILLSTGKALGAVGPNLSGTSGYATNAPGDSLLSILSNGQTYDAATIEFDVVANGTSTLSIDYLFASEEYPAYGGNSFIDLLGIFITGQNLPYTFPYVNWNIATVPGGTQSICINTINQTQNSEYYIANTANSNEAIQFDGYTSVLTASTEIVPLTTYHIKISIADANDRYFDSAIFLKFNGLSVGQTDTYKVYDLSLLEFQIRSGCEIKLNATKIDSSLLNENIAVQALCNNPLNFHNYNPEVDTFYIPPGSMSLDFSIFTQLTENSSFVTYKISQPTCSNYDRFLFLSILPTELLPSNLLSTNKLICSDSLMNFDVYIPYDYPVLEYSWSNGSDSSFSVLNAELYQNSLAVTVTDGCSQTVTDAITIYVFDAITHLVPDSIPLLNYTANLDAIILPSAHYIWSTGENTSSIIVNETGKFIVSALTYCGIFIDTVIVYEPLGIEIPQNQHSFSLYPNPAYEIVTIDIPTNINMPFNLSLHSIDGRLIWQKGGITDSTIQLNISDIQSGLYIFKLTSSFKTSLEKLIIK